MERGAWQAIELQSWDTTAQSTAAEERRIEYGIGKLVKGKRGTNLRLQN